MTDIPMFTTDNGVASLFLQSVPAWKSAYIKMLSSAAPEALLQECLDFCRTCGAEVVFASGHACVEQYPCAATLVQMQMPVDGLEESGAALFPATERTIGQWREIYNQRMADVPNAAYMTWGDEKKYLADGDCYFVHRDGKLLGIGKVSDDTIHTLASVEPGAGGAVTLALASLVCGDTVKLTVAMENRRAVSLYERLGFVPVCEVARWYKIF